MNEIMSMIIVLASVLAEIIENLFKVGKKLSSN